MLEGEQHRVLTDSMFTLRAGDAWLNAAWEPHGWSFPAEGARAVVMTFSSEFLGEETLDETPWINLFALPPRQRPRVVDRATRAGPEHW